MSIPAFFSSRSRFQRSNYLLILWLCLCALLGWSFDRYLAIFLTAVGFFIHQCLLVLGVCRLDMQWFVSTMTRGPSDKKQILLTFDDGPDPVITPAILDILSEHDVKAVFFCIGERARAHPEIVKRIVKEGHTLGHHSDTHPMWINLYTLPKLRDEIERGKDTLSELAGKDLRLYRPPVGLTNPRVRPVVEALGLRVIGWSMRSLDTRNEPIPAILGRLERQLHPGGIALFHDTLPDAPALLRQWLTRLHERGYTCIKPDEWLG